MSAPEQRGLYGCITAVLLLLWSLFAWGSAFLLERVQEDGAEPDEGVGLLVCYVWPIGLAGVAGVGFYLEKAWARSRWCRGPSGDLDLSLLWEWARSAIVPGLILVGPAVLWTLVCGAGTAVVMTWMTPPMMAEQGARLLVFGAWPIGSALALGIGFRLMGTWNRRRAAARFGRCLSCGYDLSGLVGPCPECGRDSENRGIF